MISSFPPCLFLPRWRWPSHRIRVLVMTKIPMFLRLSCLMRSCPQTLKFLPPQRIFQNHQKGTSFRHLDGGSSRECINVRSVTSASSITLSSSNTSGFTAGCSLTTAQSAGGPSEQPPCWRVTGCENAKMLPTCALNVGTVFQRHWKNSGTSAQNGAEPMTVRTAERVSKSQAA